MLKVKEIVTSRQNPTVKRICSLLEKKNRRAEGLFRFDGVKLFGEALEAGLKVRYLVLRENISPEIEALVSKTIDSGRLAHDAVFMVSEGVFGKMSEERSPEGVITVAELISERHVTYEAERVSGYSIPAGERILIAEALRDPGNLGTVIRSCAALGIDRLILSDDCADLYNPKTVRAAMGGLFRSNIDIVPAKAMAEVIKSLRASGRRVYATALHSEAYEIGKLELKRGDCFVIGNEGHGLSAETVNACDACALIPMREGSESLNAAAAAAICIWETVRVS